MTLDEAKKLIGRRVVYRHFPGALPEEGTIESVNSIFVFVRYGADVRPKATRAGDLELVAP